MAGVGVCVYLIVLLGVEGNQERELREGCKSEEEKERGKGGRQKEERKSEGKVGTERKKEGG